MLATRESNELAERLLGDTITKQRINRGQLTIHADRGSSMASKPVAFLLADLGVTKSHSRPHCSNDNPFSEAQFKTLKYRPDFPDRFGSSRTPERSAAPSTAGTTTPTATPGSTCTRLPTSTTATPAESARNAPTPSPSPTRTTRNGSSTSHPARRACPAPPGSTDPNSRSCTQQSAQRHDPTRLTGSGRAGRPPGLRQPVDPQDPRDQRLADRPSPVLSALHPDQLVVAGPGRTLVRAAHRSPAPPRRPRQRHCPLSRYPGGARSRRVRPRRSLSSMGRWRRTLLISGSSASSALSTPRWPGWPGSSARAVARCGERSSDHPSQSLVRWSTFEGPGPLRKERRQKRSARLRATALTSVFQ